MNGLSRKKACTLYAMMLIITITTNFFLPGIGNLIWSVLLSVSTAITIIYFLCTNPWKKKLTLIPETEQKEDAEHRELPESVISVNAVPPPPQKKQRLHYLDNLKSILTAIVVIHHITMSFGSVGGWYYILANYYNIFQIPSNAIQWLDQSYFMCLFFFISGYFTPISCQRKGVKLFLYDKFKRLGIPFIAYQLILGPLLAFVINGILIKHNSYSYGADPGPCWFLLWLLIFNVCYAMIDENIPFLQLKFPSTIKIIIYGALLGLIQFGIVVVIPDGTFIYMPIAVGSLPIDIVFFVSGIAAKYNGWLVNTLPNLSYWNVVAIRILTIICSLGMFAVFTFLYIVDFGHPMLPKKNESDHDCDSDNDETPWYSTIFFVVLFIFSGICCMMISLTMVQFTYSYFNFSNKNTNFFSKSAYTVYIIHPLVVVPVTYSFQMLLKVWNGEEMYFCDNTSISKTHFSHNGLIWLGLIYTIVISLIILWPLAWYIRQIPGLNKIL